MRSVTSTTPVGVSQRVTSTNVSSRYRRVAVAVASAGAISHRPASWSPRSAPNVEAESKRGRHAQSMLPSVPTRHPVCRSPIRA
jgi:hypothetical protein